MSRRAMTTGLVVLLALGGWVARTLTRRPAEARIAVAPVQHGEFVVSLPAEGTLQSDQAITVSTGKAPGQITMIAPDGTVVRAGDVFCRIEARDLQRRQTDAELAYKQANLDIANARDNAQERIDAEQRTADQAEKNMQVWEDSVGVRIKQTEDQLAFDQAEADRLRIEYERDQRMADKGYLAASEADIAKAAYDAQQFKVEQSAKDLELNRRQIESERRQRQSQVLAAKRRLDIARSRIGEMVSHAQHRAEVAAKELDSVTVALKDTTIIAPMSGTVSLFSTWQGGERRSWREGDQVSSGTPLGSIASSENMSVLCRVKERDIGLLTTDQPAEIEFDALVGRTFAGAVTSVGAVAREVWVWEDPTAQANERVFDVLVKVKQKPGSGLKPGLNARTRVIVKRLPEVVFVPLEAIFERDGKSYSYVKQGNGFVRRQVEPGERNDIAVVVRKGLSQGEMVALSDPTRAPEPSARKSG